MGCRQWHNTASFSLQRYSVRRSLVARWRLASLLFGRWHDLPVGYNVWAASTYAERPQWGCLDRRLLSRRSFAGFRLRGWLIEVVGCLPGTRTTNHLSQDRGIRRGLWGQWP